MTRQLRPWAHPDRTRTRLRLTWPGDMLRAVRGRFGYLSTPPTNAPPPSLRPASRLSVKDLTRNPALLNTWSWRLDYQVVGLDALAGIAAPVIFAVNQQGVLDWTVLSNVLPPRLRTQQYAAERSIIRGRSVAIFSAEANSAQAVGEFSTQAAELAHHHSLPVVPVAMVGTFKLKEVLRLSLRRKPRVSIRFGAPIYVRGRTVQDATAEIQASVEALFRRGDLSWWAVQRGTTAPLDTAKAPPRWRRLWDQAGSRRSSKPRVWR